ncbi:MULTISPECIES: hypothetical protein [unclassified Arthrobacter]|uniref:8-oxoguanine DNA glycosylase OGG fold protein n=1 Tax=unclassified Arthrobacter TaxID=235627 RepID=UPI0035B37A8C
MVSAPEELAAWVMSHPRSEAIDRHGFSIKIAKWNERVGALKGSPLVSEDGGLETGLISRGGLFKLARRAREDETGRAACHLFWQSLAWGTGNSHRNTPGRITSVSSNEEQTAVLLRDSARLAVTSPEQAFLQLQPNRPALKSWGPNFFTKYLYFAGGGAIDHSSLIVDARVLGTLAEITDKPSLRPRYTNYSVSTYSAACAVMRTWAEELSSPERTVGADEVERWAFEAGRGWRKRR